MSCRVARNNLTSCRLTRNHDEQEDKLSKLALEQQRSDHNLHILNHEEKKTISALALEPVVKHMKRKIV